MQTIDEALFKLSKSKFRSSFHLTQKDKKTVREKGIDVIEQHCAEIVKKRLAPAVIQNDGKQTPFRGYPVFVAQHACACCCRGCLNKWYRVPLGTELTDSQQKKIVRLLTEWIRRETEEQDGTLGNG